MSIFLLLFRKKSKEKPQGFQGVPKVPKQLLMEAEALYKTIHLVPWKQPFETIDNLLSPQGSLCHGM